MVGCWSGAVEVSCEPLSKAGRIGVERLRTSCLPDQRCHGLRGQPPRGHVHGWTNWRRTPQHVVFARPALPQTVRSSLCHAVYARHVLGRLCSPGKAASVNARASRPAIESLVRKSEVAPPVCMSESVRNRVARHQRIITGSLVNRGEPSRSRAGSRAAGSSKKKPASCELMRELATPGRRANLEI